MNGIKMSGRWRAGFRARLLAGCAAVAAVLAVSLIPASALAQDGQGRAVRLSSVDGHVELSKGGTVLTDHALVNTPLFEGTRIVTGDDGRAEVQFEDGSVARIAPNSSMTLAALQQDGETKVVLDSGMGYFEIEGGSGQGSAMRVGFDDSKVTAREFTVVRIKMDQPPGEMAVFTGNAHLDENSGEVNVDVRGGETVTLNANDPEQYQLAESVEPDSWDAWNSDRDQALSAAQSTQTPATEGMADSNNPAWGDLNENGTWYDTNQGYVWSPYEASDSGWDPYGNGYWMDQPGYGYMWISAEPWGYLPYQCGAWNYYGGFGWGWAPGVCSPWWGAGGGWGFNIGDAPRWYRHPVRPGPPRYHQEHAHADRRERAAATDRHSAGDRREPQGAGAFEHLPAAARQGRTGDDWRKQSGTAAAAAGAGARGHVASSQAAAGSADGLLHCAAGVYTEPQCVPRHGEPAHWE